MKRRDAKNTSESASRYRRRETAPTVEDEKREFTRELNAFCEIAEELMRTPVRRTPGKRR